MKQPRICLYYRKPPDRDRWTWLDRYPRRVIRRLVRGRPRMGGLDKVFVNLCLGLDRLGIDYSVNLPFRSLESTDRIGVLGRGRDSLEGYTQKFPLVAGIGLMNHPSEWPSLCQDYPIAFYLQHSDWTNEIYKPFFGDRCRTWPVGIDTKSWRPQPSALKTHDFLIYDKIMWDRPATLPQLLTPIERELTHRGLAHTKLRYGAYTQQQYREALMKCRAMIFLCEHESQGLAYLEALASGLPILAWDQGKCLDPNRYSWGQPNISASSVPFFDARCGHKFADAVEFAGALDEFMEKLGSGRYAPRDFVLENLTVEKCSQHFLDLLEEARA